MGIHRVMIECNSGILASWDQKPVSDDRNDRFRYAQENLTLARVIGNIIGTGRKCWYKHRMSYGVMTDLQKTIKVRF